MRKDRGLDGVGEGEREVTLFPQNSTDQRFKTAFCRFFPQNSTDQRFKTAFCRFFNQN
nr:MAG: hypothetical protein [Bacteriophage sp.]